MGLILPFHDNDGSNFLAPEKNELISLFLLKLVATFLFFLISAHCILIFAGISMKAAVVNGRHMQTQMVVVSYEDGDGWACVAPVEEGEA